MAGEWINRKARDMCDCSRCQPDGSLNECMRGTYESGIRAGLEHAGELLHATPWDVDAVSRAIRDLLTNPPPPAGQRETTKGP